MEIKLKKVLKPEDKYLVITDLDGTFLSNGANMTHHIKNNIAVKKLKELGHEFIIASGRSPQLIKPIYDHLKLDTPVIAFHGGLILDPTKKHKNLSLNDSPVSIELVKEIVKETKIIQNTIFTEIVGYGESNSITHEEDINEITFNPYEIVFATKRNMYNEEKISQLINKRWGRFVRTKFLPGGSNLDYDMILLVASDVDKMYAVEKISKYYKVPKERIIYFGDNYNDLRAIEYVEHGVAMKNATKRIINSAKYVTKYSNFEGGVGKFLLELIN